MSGGYFEYIQHRLDDVVEVLQENIDSFDKDTAFDMKLIFNNAIKVVKESRMYIQRIDWFLSGDDGFDTFVKKTLDHKCYLDEKWNER